MKMIIISNKINIYIILCLCIALSSLGQKQIAVTIDDPNTEKTSILSWQERNSAILKALDNHGIKAALFVCGMRLNNSNGEHLINLWDEHNHLICNHSYSHMYYNSKKSCIYIEDFRRGDSVIKKYKNYTKLFRYPYLKEGDTKIKIDSMRLVLKQEGYKNGSVTIDASDWYIDLELENSLKNNINTDLTPYKEYYIKHILNRAQYYDSLANKIFKRNIKHTLLIHHSLLNALCLNDLLEALKNNGWLLIDAKTAFNDEIFSNQPLIVPCGESLVWQFAMLNQELCKNLRYPAEDGKYEKDSLKNYIQKFIK